MIHKYTHKQNGLTLIEMMIGITISSILMVGVSQIFMNSKRTYKLNTELARTQENIRYAVDLMAQDIRMAGYTGCGGNTVTNTLNPVDVIKYNTGVPVYGFDGSASTFPYATETAGTDSIIIYRGGIDTGLKFDQKQNAANFKVNTTNHGLEDDDIIMLSDCTHTAIVQVTSANPANVTIVHNSGAGSPGNCVKGMGSTDCITSISYNWNKDAHVVKYDATGYYIAPSVNGVAGNRSLYRMLVNKAAPVAEELVEGVENMQITYGYDSNADGFANRYVKADAISAANFENVVSVRVGLLFQSQDNAKRSVKTDPFILAGTTINSAASPGALEYAEDNRLRFAINTTIKLRNQGVK